MNKKGGKKGHPSFPIMDGHTQPGAGQMSCYRCGVKGHRAGDPSCGEKTERFTRMLRNGSGSKTEHEPKVRMAKVKGKERKAEKETATSNLFATIGARGMGTAALQQLATFLHDGPQGGDKRKRRKGSTSLPAKAVKRAKKEIMAMVMEGIKGEGVPAKPKGSKAEQASETLLALVRGERKKSASSMISVDLKNLQRILSPRARSRKVGASS